MRVAITAMCMNALLRWSADAEDPLARPIVKLRGKRSARSLVGALGRAFRKWEKR